MNREQAAFNALQSALLKGGRWLDATTAALAAADAHDLARGVRRVMTDDGPVKRLARKLVEDGARGVPWEDASDDDRTEAMERAFAAVVAALQGGSK